MTVLHLQDREIDQLKIAVENQIKTNTEKIRLAKSDNKIFLFTMETIILNDILEQIEIDKCQSVF